MRVNTKNCTPIAGAPDEAIIRPNKYIFQQPKNEKCNKKTASNAFDLHTGFFHDGGSSTAVTPTAKSTAGRKMPGAPKKKSKNDMNTSIAGGGRQVMYIPTIMYTPVQTSSRHRSDSPRSVASTASNSTTGTTGSNNNTGTRRLLSADDVEELNVKLEHLFLGEDDQQDDDEGEEAQAPPKPMGRVETTAFNYKSCSTTSVIRSARFQK